MNYILFVAIAFIWAFCAEPASRSKNDWLTFAWVIMIPLFPVIAHYMGLY